jgi:hypothetical protein
LAIESIVQIYTRLESLEKIVRSYLYMGLLCSVLTVYFYIMFDILF